METTIDINQIHSTNKVIELPIRDGNGGCYLKIDWDSEVIELPIRDGNISPAFSSQ